MGQVIGTVNVQVGQSLNPKVPSINYGGSRTLKGAQDLSLVGNQDSFVITYRAATDSFVMSDAGAAVVAIDAGFF